jgi:hypothetical protein
VTVNYHSGFGTYGVAMSNDALWDNYISNYDHVYIVVLSGRAKDQHSMPGTDGTVYRLLLSKGPWPLAKTAV